MKFTSEHIQQLLIEKLTGTIEADDDLVIEQLLRENKEVFLQWKVMQDQLEQAQVKGFLSEPSVEEEWLKIAPLVKKSKKARVFLFTKTAAAAAIILLVISGIYLFIKKDTPVSTIVKLSDKEKRSSIRLAMDNGEEIYFKKNAGRIFQLGVATIRAGNTGISYSLNGAATQPWVTLSIPAILDYKITLSDGTQVWMNAETRLRFPFSFTGKTREVYIDGEAYFNVAKNAGKPFIVHAGKTAIKVLGTQFNVNTYDQGKIKTSLVEGAVAATDRNRFIDLKPGFEAVYSSLQQDFKVNGFDQMEVLSWMKGVYYFHNNSLKDLSKLLLRWYDVEVRFENSSLENKTFSGEIVKSQPIELFLENIRISNGIRLELKNGVLYFR